jgi:AcrR family transcriptional regulator
VRSRFSIIAPSHQNTKTLQHFNTAIEKTKRQVISEAAAKLFRDKGYSATSMRDLAEMVQLKASSLYNHIGSKEEILRDICFENARRFQTGMEQIEHLGGSAADKVKALLRLHIAIATEDVTSVTAFNDEWRHLSEPYLSEFKAMRRDYEHRFQAIIEAGIRQGEFKNLNAFTSLYTIFSSVRWLHDWYKPERNTSPEELFEQISTLLLQGLAAEL